MTKLLITFTMSLDGFIAGPDVGMDLPMGRGGERLHDWMFAPEPQEVSELDRQMAKEATATPGAVLVGRRTFDIGLGPWGDTPYPVPTFVVTHRPRDPMPMKSATFTFVSDGIESALRQAREAAGGKDVVIMGADLAQQYLKAGLVDELVLQIAPVLLGSGTRLFDHIGDTPIELVTTRSLQSPAVTHLRYEIVKPA